MSYQLLLGIELTDTNCKYYVAVRTFHVSCYNFPCSILYLQVISAEGEQRASVAMKEAADIMAQSPEAIQLRYLQTLASISTERESTIIFPLPIDTLAS